MRIKFLKKAADVKQPGKIINKGDVVNFDIKRAESAINKGIAVEVKKSTQERLSEKTTKK